MSEVDFVTLVHKSTKRDYVQRVVEVDKAVVAEKAIQFGHDYWDGDRLSGYGGYRYDGRWIPVACDIAAHFGLKPGDRVLDIGCAKGFLMRDLMAVVPGLDAWRDTVTRVAASR